MLRTKNDGLIDASVSGITCATDHIRIIYLRPLQQFTWLAGQYVYISFAGYPARPYSIACAPGHKELEIHVKRGTGVTSNYIMDELKEGETAQLALPQGESTFTSAMKEPVIAVAGGLGIAPLKAIAEQAAIPGFRRNFTLYWGTGDDKERYLDDYFSALSREHKNFKYVPVSERPVTEKLARDFDDLADCRIYISGPPAMISATIPLLLDKGAARSKISYDRHPEAASVII